MNGYLIDSCVILDLILDDPEWANWSEETLADCAEKSQLYINPIVYSEVSIGFDRIEDLEHVMVHGGFSLLNIPREALFLAGKAFLGYKKRKGMRRSPLPDFFIGAHAVIQDLTLVTRDVKRFKTAYPTIRLIHP